MDIIINRLALDEMVAKTIDYLSLRDLRKLSQVNKNNNKIVIPIIFSKMSDILSNGFVMRGIFKYDVVNLLYYAMINNINVVFAVRLIDYAAMHGQLNNIKWLHENMEYYKNHISVQTKMRVGLDNLESSFWAMIHAASNGHLEVMKWLVEHRGEKFSCDSVYESIRSGQYETVRYVIDNPHLRCDSVYISDEEIFRQSITSGNVEIFKYLQYKLGIPISDDHVHLSISCGSCEILSYMLQNVDKYNNIDALNILIKNAGFCGDVKIFEVLHDKYCKLSSCGDNAIKNVSNISATHGRIDIIKHLYEKYPDIMQDTSNIMRMAKTACDHGELDTLKYLCDKHCSSDKPILAKMKVCMKTDDVHNFEYMWNTNKLNYISMKLLEVKSYERTNKIYEFITNRD